MWEIASTPDIAEYSDHTSHAICLGVSAPSEITGF